MNDSNKIPIGQLPLNQAFRRRMVDGPYGRGGHQGFTFNNGERSFYPGQGPQVGTGRGSGPPPPPPRGRGGRFGPSVGRGYFPETERFIDRGPPQMGARFDPGRSMIPPPPPPPPPPIHGNLVRGIPPPPPPRMSQGQWIPPPPLAPMHMSQPATQPQAIFNPYTQQLHHSQMISNMHQPQQITQSMRHAQSPIVSAAPVQQFNNANLVVQSFAGAPSQKTASAGASQSQIDQAWTEHTAPNSMKYFYNAITQESTFSKPEALMRGKEQTKAVEQPWIEYKDATTGREYYSNGVITSWEKPAGFLPSVSAVPERKHEEPVRKKKKANPSSKTEFASKAEAIAGFKGLLLSKDIQPTMKWNDVVKACSSDPRWDACEILTLGERRQALAEYQTKRANELRDLEREERMRAKDAFTKLLTDVLPTVGSFNPMTSRFAAMRDFLSKDDRFYAVEDEATRDTLFLEFCEEVRKREERQRRNKKRESQLSLYAFLREHSESGELTYASTWSSFVSSLSDKSKSDSRFKISEGMSESDRELYFSDFVIELQAAEDEKRRRIRDAKSRAEKAQREGFIELLISLAKQGVLRPSTKWCDVEKDLSDSQAFGLVKAQDRDTPRELFQDFMDEWIELYRRDRVFLARLVKPSTGPGINVTNETNYEEFTNALLDAAAHSSEQYSNLRLILKSEDPISSARVYLDELVNRVEEVAITAMRRNKRRRLMRDDSSEDEGEIIEDGEIEASPHG